eukprot:7384836-Pyramimonas_sp.AAC.1
MQVFAAGGGRFAYVSTLAIYIYRLRGFVLEKVGGHVMVSPSSSLVYRRVHNLLFAAVLRSWCVVSKRSRPKA